MYAAVSVYSSVNCQLQIFSRNLSYSCTEESELHQIYCICAKLRSAFEVHVTLDFAKNEGISKLHKPDNNSRCREFDNYLRPKKENIREVPRSDEHAEHNVRGT